MINFKNTAENLAIILIVMLATAFTTYHATLNSALESNKATNSALIPTIVEAIKKETTAINNHTSNSVDIKKLKARKNDSLKIVFENSQPSDNTLKQQNTTSRIEYKEGDTFGDLILMKKEHLTRQQRRRMGLKKKMSSLNTNTKQ